jgi:ATP-binding cassette subfamily A (ABC1) protein 3
MDKVIPSDYGQRLNPCFLCMPSFYRCGSRNRRAVSSSNDDGSENRLMNEANDDAFEMEQMPDNNYEAPPVICKRLEASGDFLKISNLQKTFSGGFKAVRGVNVKMYDSQIFALLGHNGAGKTTMISMLTGLIKKSQGQASCYNTDLFEEMEEVREFMGVCPQHDVLFDLLTPREHLDIFYDFKGGKPERKQQEIDSLIRDVGLTIDQRKPAKTLSGGNKRKLSVSIALCGGSRLVLLDEPTSGMDLGARRNLWDMLKSYKKDRIIILTTHYMDEADVLGDRIGIMCKGTLQCIGSSLFLKNRFGIGYKVTFVKKRRRAHPAIDKFMQSYFAGVIKQSEVHEEISYVIPKSQAQNFGGFF